MLEAIEGVKKSISEHSDSLDNLHGKLAGHGQAVDDLAKLVDGMPDHDSLMKGVHGLLGDHLGDHSGKVMDEINKLPLPPDEKIMLQAMENMEESVLGTMLEAIEGVKKTISEHSDSLDNLHGKLAGHGQAVDDLAKLMDGIPDHDSLMQGVHGLLGEHLGDHSGKVTDEINKLPLPPDEKVLLQAIKNMEESMLTTVLEAIEKMKDRVDPSCVKEWLEDHSKELHGKLDDHGKKYEDLAKLVDGIPDHDTLMQGVHGLLGEHMNDHGGKIMSSIAEMPLPPDEKIMLQAIENMEETVLGQTLEAINKLKSDLEGHNGSLHGKFDAFMDGMPDHDSLMKGVHGLLGDHLGDHSGKVTDEINKLPLPPDEKVLLQAMENMEESVLATVLEAIESLKKTISEHSDSLDNLHGKLEGHGQAVDDLAKLVDGMPDHDSLMQGVHGLLGEHLGDGHGKIMGVIEALPLNKSEKVMLQAMENMEETMLTTVLEAIEKLKDRVDPSCVKGWLENHSKELHGKLDDHGKKYADMAKLMEGMPDHDTLMQGVHGLLGEHMNDHGGKIMSSIDSLPLPADEKIMLQAIENMEETVLGQTLEAIRNIQMNVTIQGSKALDTPLGSSEQAGARLSNSTERAPIQKQTQSLPSSSYVRSSRVSDSAERVPAQNRAQSSPSLKDASSSRSEPRSKPVPDNTPPPKWSQSRLSSTPSSQKQEAPTTKYSQSTVKKGNDLTTDAKRKFDFAKDSERARSSSPSRTARAQTDSVIDTKDSDTLSCKCGYTCGTETALSRHLTRNSDRGHARV